MGVVYSLSLMIHNTLIPFVQQLEQIHSRRFTYVVADAGYDSHENLIWLKNNHYLSCIKASILRKRKLGLGPRIL